MVCEGGVVGGLFDGADDAFAELQPHVVFALVGGFLLALEVVLVFGGGEHGGDAVVVFYGDGSGLYWCLGVRDS